MNKSKIIAAVAAAVVLVSGVAAAVPVLRGRVSAETPETTLQAPTETFTYKAAAEPVSHADETEAQESTAEAAAKAAKKTKETTKAKSTGKTAVPSTSAKAETTAPAEEENTDLWYVDILHRNLTPSEQKAIHDYSYNDDGSYFYTDDSKLDDDDLGYDEIYEAAAGFAVKYTDRLAIRFDYDDSAWLIQMRKGQYGGTLIGGEIGIFAAPGEKTNDLHEKDIDEYLEIPEKYRLQMSMEMYWDENGDGSYEKLFSRPYSQYWWCTGFTWGNLSRSSSPVTELIMNARITFSSSDLAEIFENGLVRSGFSRYTSASLPNDYVYQNGSDVYFRWRSVYKSNFTDVPVNAVTTAESEKTEADNA